MNDTDLSMDKTYREKLMKLAGKKRMLMSLSMSRLVLEIMTCGIMEKFGAKDFKKHVFFANVWQ